MPDMDGKGPRERSPRKKGKKMVIKMPLIKENTKLIQKKHRLLQEIEVLEKKIAENVSKYNFEKAKKMNIYLVSQDINNGCGTTDAIIVIAKNKNSARHIKKFEHKEEYGEWVSENQSYLLKVKKIGVADTKSEKIVLESFNAGRVADEWQKR